MTGTEELRLRERGDLVVQITLLQQQIERREEKLAKEYRRLWELQVKLLELGDE